MKGFIYIGQKMKPSMSKAILNQRTKNDFAKRNLLHSKHSIS